tara:strand:- start:254 stop:1435 length:1182 start_codon:yes stop_codon:yes gene_type:complete
MITSGKALELVLSHAAAIGKTVEVDLMDALGHVLAVDVISRMDMPPFRQSAMDGYAIKSWDSDTYTLIGEIEAGSDFNPELNRGEAVRIFTGAAVPDSATAVMMQEKVTVKGKRLRLEMPARPELNIRAKGEQVKKGATALARRTVIKGAHVGFLAGLGITKVKVIKKPSIAIVVTGNELVPPGTFLPYGKIYESNGAMLKTSLSALGYKNTRVVGVVDNYEETKNVLRKTISNADIVIITGGVSVGDYDFVGKALIAIGVEQIFYKVNQKPGKPLFFGRKDSTSVFGLPGNPGAVLTCFYIYVYPLLKTYEGAEEVHLPRISMPVLSAYRSTEGRAEFLKAELKDSGVHILGGQSSAKVKAFGEANALVFLPEKSTLIRKGDHVQTILLPNL